MKDLAGLVGEENKYVTGIFFWLLRILWGENVKKSPRTPRRTGQAPLPLAKSLSRCQSGGSRINANSKIGLEKDSFNLKNLELLI